MFDDLSIYEFKIAFTQTVNHYDQCQDFDRQTKHPETATVRVVASEVEIARAWLRKQYEGSEMKIKATAVHDIDGLILCRE